jgi:hypothetical protein
MDKSTDFYRRDLFVSLFLVIMFSSIGFGSDESVSPDWICIPGVKVGPITSTASEGFKRSHVQRSNVQRFFKKKSPEEADSLPQGFLMNG